MTEDSKQTKGKAKGDKKSSLKKKGAGKSKSKDKTSSKEEKTVSWLPFGGKNKDNNNDDDNSSKKSDKKRETTTKMPRTNSETEALMSDEVEELRAEFKKVKKELKKLRKAVNNNDDTNDESHSHWDDDGVKVSSEKGEVGDEMITDEKLPPDTFSFFLISRPCSIPFGLPILVFTFQITMYMLVALDIILNDDRINPLKLPVNVGTQVRIAQFLAIIVAVITQDDIRTGISHIREGYSGEELSKAFYVHRNVGLALRGPSFHVARWKWYTSAVARLIEGTLGLLVTFFLIIQSFTVLDLLLNFTAMSFVSQLDEVWFFLSNEGFAGKSNRITANAIEDTEYKREIRKGKGLGINRGILYFFMLCLLLGAWGYTIWVQVTNVLLCKTVYVQFGDEFLPHLGSFSGLYDIRPGVARFWTDERVPYFERRISTGVLSSPTIEDGGRGMFAYCRDMAAWTFSFPDPVTGERNPCDNWTARTSETETFDFPETALLNWYVRNSDNREISITFFRLQCYDCNRVPKKQRCSGREGATCGDGICECPEGWYGLRCEFHAPCDSLQMDVRFDSFPILGGSNRGEWSDSFELFTISMSTTDEEGTENANYGVVESYHRPVYISEYQQDIYDLIFYTGRRWAVTSSSSLPDVNIFGRDARDALALYFNRDFHSYWSNYSVSFITSPMDFGTPEDDTSPAGLPWLPPIASYSHASRTADLAAAMSNKLETDPYRAVEAVLLCSTCDDELNPCQYDGICYNGACQCENGATGTLCENSPVGNGFCDIFFNTIEFQYDGGDCCESTCVSTLEHTCGRDQTGYTNIGYPHCYMDNVESDWNSAGDPLSGEQNLAQSGRSIALSGNGNMMVVGQPGSDNVALFDRDGSQWDPRGIMQGPPGSHFGALTSSSVGGSLEMMNNPSTRIPIVVAAAAPNDPSSAISSQPGFVRVYECSFECSQIGNDLTNFFNFDSAVGDDYFIVAIELSSDGNILVVSALTDVPGAGGRIRRHRLQENADNYRCTALVYEQDSSTSIGWRVRSQAFFEDQQILDASLSGSGNTIAIQFFNVHTDSAGETVYRSQVQAFQWDGTDAQDYIPAGAPLVTRSLEDGIHNSVSLADSGNMLAIGNQNNVRVYDWVSSENEWVQLGNTIRVVTPQSNVALSNDGSVVAIDRSVPPNIDGAGVNFGNGVFVETYQWGGNDWEPLGEVISPDGQRQSITSRDSTLSLSANGHVLAIGLPWAGIDATGNTYVYEFPPTQCPQGAVLLRLSITTGDQPQDISWTLRRSPGELLLSGGPYEYSVSTFVDEICVAEDGCVTFSMDGSASYAIFLGGVEYESGRNVEESLQVRIGSCQ